MARNDKSGNRSGPRTLDAEEESLWTQVADQIKPLTKRKIREISSDSPKQDQTKLPKRKTNPASPQNKINPQNVPYEHGKAPGLDKRTQMRLRRGQVAIDARLDLHGMTQREAHAALNRFILDAYHGGRRSVLVITGKGLQADGRIGVLRAAVPGWLNEAPLKACIRAFDHAAPKDGGEGALYILLRKAR